MPRPASSKKKFDDLVAKVFWDGTHPTNKVLRKNYGTYDASMGVTKYNPTKSEVRKQLTALGYGPKPATKRKPIKRTARKKKSSGGGLGGLTLTP